MGESAAIDGGLPGTAGGEGAAGTGRTAVTEEAATGGGPPLS